MSENETISGKCLCGSVGVEAKTNKHVGACHCSMCRKWNGGPLMVVDCGSNVVFTGEDHVKRYASSDWAERGFCTSCGTHLFYYFKPQNMYIVCAGLFDQTDGFIFDHQVFIDEKPDYYTFANKTEDMTAQQVMEKFS